MSQLLHIRREVLKLTQSEMAAIAGVRQATVSRWEKGALEPSLAEMQAIREEAIRRGIDWRDAWFFPAPTEGEAG